MALITDKGSQIMDGLILRQYQESPNLKQYLHAYVEEMDDLFCAIEDVYFGRFLETATGAQLDVIGEILQQSRNVDLGTIFFGFQGATGADGFGDTEDTQVGGIFKSLEVSGATITPLDDNTYRRVLTCKGALLNSVSNSLEDIYSSITILLNRVPELMILTEPANLQVQLELSTADTRADEELLILYMARYFIPAGITFSIITSDRVLDSVEWTAGDVAEWTLGDGIEW